jgi:hypothetical protein
MCILGIRLAVPAKATPVTLRDCSRDFENRLPFTYENIGE